MAALSIQRFADLEQLSGAAAAEFCRVAREAVAERGSCAVALSGGSTPRRLFQLLADEPYLGQVDWSHIEIFWSDERAVEPNSPDSNFKMAKDALLDRLRLAPRQVHRMQAERSDCDAAALDYEKEIASVLSGGGVPSESTPAMDLVLLGMGPDGHTASLFPETAALVETRRWVVANQVPKLGAERMTMTAPYLNSSRHVFFLVSGADKAETLRRVLEGPSVPRELPAQLIRT
ncbi:MAG TPA: 6-phosphogluconolactonase, partial [Polyangiaceae bacterium]